MTNSGGSVIKNYEYDAFGVEIGKDENDTNPFRYCGEYFDLSSGTYYLRNRNYNPGNGRFLTEDPIRDGLNWYTYCANDPITYVDPSGLIIQVTGSETDQQTILDALQQLTDSTLEIRDGIIVITQRFLNSSLPIGTELINRLINSTHICTIQIGDNGNSASFASIGSATKPGVGSDATVSYDPNANPNILTTDPKTNVVSGASRPTFIGLAHELIHTDRGMRGIVIDLNQTSNFIYLSSATKVETPSFSGYKYTYTTENVRKEELATVGLMYNNEGDITENMIRAEHSLNLRGAY